jgi:lipopolysaccharide/colanic/teichoic acid biosynthesis glycosyltransferase
VEKYGDNYWLLSKVKPGLSGLWQVSGRSETDYEQRVALDVYYIQSWSLWLDLYILLKTIVVVLKGDGAY